MKQFTEAYEFRGRTLVDRDGEKIGKVDEVYSCQEGGQPEWALVHTGLLGSPSAITPAATASCRVDPMARADPLRTQQRERGRPWDRGAMPPSDRRGPAPHSRDAHRRHPDGMSVRSDR